MAAVRRRIRHPRWRSLQRPRLMRQPRLDAIAARRLVGACARAVSNRAKQKRDNGREGPYSIRSASSVACGASMAERPLQLARSARRQGPTCPGSYPIAGKVFQSSRPWVPLLALNRSVPFRFRSACGEELPWRLMSFTSRVPRLVPSLRQSSVPCFPSRAVKNSVPPLCQRPVRRSRSGIY